MDCECGCSQKVSKEGNRFIAGHNRRVFRKEKVKAKLCECGCNNYANSGKRFILGHNNPMLGRKRPDVSIRLIMNNPMNNPEIVQKIVEKKTGRTKENDEGVRKQAEKLTGRTKETYEYIRKQAEKMKKITKEISNRPEVKERNRRSLLKLWKNPNFVRKQMKARHVKQNKLEVMFEQWLTRNFPNEWKFVGDGEVVINGKSPDFINVNGKKQIIEIFGDYWHKGQNPEDRIKIFEPFGYKTLVLWEYELKNIKEIEDKIRNFYGEK